MKEATRRPPKQLEQRIPKRLQKLVALAVLLALCALWGYVIYLYTHPLTDWQGNYFPAIRDLLNGNSPYTGHRTYNPFWTYLLLAPFALLPPEIGSVAVGLVCMAVFAFVAWKLGAKPLSLAMLLSTPQLMFLSRNGNIDWLVVLGFIMPPQIGLFFVLIKPQIGLAVAVFWFIEAWRNGKIREIVRVFAPVSAAYLVGYLLFGVEAIWRGTEFIYIKYGWAATTFPFTIPVGLALLYKSLRSRNIMMSISASPFLAPYIAFYSWPAALLGIVDNTWLMVPAVIGMWILAIIKMQF